MLVLVQVLMVQVLLLVLVLFLVLFTLLTPAQAEQDSIHCQSHIEPVSQYSLLGKGE